MGMKVDGTASGRRVFAVRVAVETPERLAEMALDRGYYFMGPGGERLGAAGQLMDAIARGELKLREGP